MKLEWENENLLTPNALRRKMGLPVYETRRHHLVVWPDDSVSADWYVVFKCIKCSRGKLVMDRLAVRHLVKGGLPDFFRNVAWGSWGDCREDLPHHLERPNPPTTPS